MAMKLLVVDGDGTIAKFKNPFYEVAKELSCYAAIKRYAEEYLAGLISYHELIRRQNPIFKEAGRRYASEHGCQKCDLGLFSQVLDKVVGNNCVSASMRVFLSEVRNSEYEIAMISSGWDAVISKVAREARIAYWRANGVLFEDGEFSGTVIRVPADKIQEFEAAIALFGTEYKNVAYLGDSEFDLIAMEFVHSKGGECFVLQSSCEQHGLTFPAYVRRFASLDCMGNYLTTQRN